MTPLNRAVFPRGVSLLEQLAQCHRREQQHLAALLDTPDHGGKRRGARDHWFRDLAYVLGDSTPAEKATLMEKLWKRYLVSSRWAQDRNVQLLPPGTEFPYWHLHVISKLHGEKEALCAKQILNIIK